jgi:hypothetical protein
MDYTYLKFIGLGLMFGGVLLVFLFELIQSVIRWIKAMDTLPVSVKQNILKAIFLSWR